MRLIDAEELKELWHWDYGKPPFSRKKVLNMIDMARTIDAVPVIRCKDCKYYFPEGHVRCWNIRGMHYPVDPDEFCSRAERRDNDSN